MWSERAIGERVDIQGIGEEGWKWEGKTKRYIVFTLALRLGTI